MSPVPQLLPLRPYQTEAVEAVEAAWDRGVNRPACVMATGLGKSRVFAHLAVRAHDRGLRPLILVNRDELVQQTRATLHSVIPSASIGIVKAGSREVHADFIVGSVQTLARINRRVELADIGMIVADECHAAVARSWMDVLEHYGSFAGLPTVGLTATMMRGDKKKLGDVWQEIVYAKPIRWGIDNGYLVDVRGKTVTVAGLNLDDVKFTHGDFADQDLATALELSNAAEATAAAYLAHAADRQGVLFAPTVESAFSFTKAFNSVGIVTAVIHADTPIEDRRAVYRMYEAGTVQVLSNVNVLVEGWDAPWASCCVIARPTHSVGRYIQQVGRVLRPWVAGGKHDALVLDVVGAAAKHSLAHIGVLCCTEDEEPVEVKDGETLTEAAERASSELKDKKVGRLVLGDIDLFRDRSTNWLKTEGGVWFIPVREADFFLWAAPDGTYSVGRQPKAGGRAERLMEGVTLEAGMSWSELAAFDEDASISGRTSSWRKGNQKPSEAQIGKARGIGIGEPETMTKRDLSDKISIRLASRSLDRRFAPRKDSV